MSEKFSALKASDFPWFDFGGNEEPKCPHCGKDFDIAENEAWKLYEEGEHEVACPSCDGDFTVRSNARWTFSTDSQDDEDDQS